MTSMDETHYTVKPTARFKKDLKRVASQGHDLAELEGVIDKLANGVRLDGQYYDHALSGQFSGCRECHIKPDWLLIYEIDTYALYLYLTRTGSHSELFE
jgi:mRNA interferase YafQ